MSSSNSTPKPLSISLSSSKNAKKPSSSSQLSRDTKSLPHRPQHHQPPSSSRRNHFANASDSDEDDETKPPTHEEVLTFDRDAGGAIGVDPNRGKKKELVIKVESGNNWRDRAGRKRGKNLLPREVQAQMAGEGGEEGVKVEREGPSVAYGISYAKRKEEDGGVGEGKDVDMGGVEEEAEVKKPLTEDEIALHSLVNGVNGERRSDLVISAQNNEEEYDDRQDETTSFREDVASRPDMASLDQYAAVPVEEFGAALLRGMGWKEGQPVGRGKYGANDAGNEKGKKARVPERRPGYLGIGAKDIGGKKGAEAEIGAWGKAAMRKSKRDGGSSGEGLYMPVMMKQKNTGALITEEEFRAMSKEGGEGKKDDEWKERRDRNLEKDGRERRRRDYDDDDNDDYERSKRGSSRRDRSRSSDDKDRRRRRRDDSADRGSDKGKSDRYYRDREKYRDRDRDRDSDRKHRDSRRHRDDYASSSSRSSRRDRDSDRESYRRKDRYEDDDRKRSSRREEVY
ncbi:hypothetical protein FQN54_007362 [Arachnomyces sp. PD_36]|nr:hypothetical protein FQN54_007362 [Arachnomyces sp. PD_36]